jgi:hypothetical protein
LSWRAQKILDAARSADIETENPDQDRELIVAILTHELVGVEPETEKTYASYICEVLQQAAADVQSAIDDLDDGLP